MNHTAHKNYYILLNSFHIYLLRISIKAPRVSSLKTEAVDSSETLVHTYQNIFCHISPDSNIKITHLEFTQESFV